MNDFQSAYQEEKARLDRTLEEIDRQLQRLRSIPVYTGHDFTEQLLEENRETQRKQLEQSIREPYLDDWILRSAEEEESRYTSARSV